MAFQPETSTFDAGVFQLETSTPVQGGVGGASNSPLLNAANRTRYLKDHVDALEAAATGNAPLNSPAFTGTPTVPTPASDDSSTKAASTAFVKAQGGSMSKSVAGNSNVVLSAAEASSGILTFTGALTGNIAVVVPNTAKAWVIVNSTSGAFTLTVKTAAGTGIAVTQGKTSHLYCDATNVAVARTDFVDTALTGNPTVPTQAADDATTKAASTGFVFNATDGMATISVAGNSNVNVTTVQAGSALINLTGALTGNINLVMPTQTGQWVIFNGATGAFTITCKTAGGTGVTLPAAQPTQVAGDGTNIYAVSSSGRTGDLAFTTGNTAKIGTVKANGSLLSRTTYAALYAYAVSSGNMAANDGAWTSGQYSPGDGATTFRVPDWRGYHPRAWDDARGIDSGRAVGSVQADALLTHLHPVSDPTHTHGVSDPTHHHNTTLQQYTGSGPATDNSNYGVPGGTPIQTADAATGISIVGASTGLTVQNNAGGAAENRVKNIAALVCIYY